MHIFAQWELRYGKALCGKAPTHHCQQVVKLRLDCFISLRRTWDTWNKWDTWDTWDTWDQHGEALDTSCSVGKLHGKTEIHINPLQGLKLNFCEYNHESRQSKHTQGLRIFTRVATSDGAKQARTYSRHGPSAFSTS